jgi:hypothetical protein
LHYQLRRKQDFSASRRNDNFPHALAKRKISFEVSRFLGAKTAPRNEKLNKSQGKGSNPLLACTGQDYGRSADLFQRDVADAGGQEKGTRTFLVLAECKKGGQPEFSHLDLLTLRWRPTDPGKLFY